MTNEAAPKFIRDNFLHGPPEIDFSRSSNEATENRQRLGDCFLGFLLLTAEVLSDPITLFFIETVGRRSDDELARAGSSTVCNGL